MHKTENGPAVSNNGHADEDNRGLCVDVDLGAVRAFLAVVDEGQFTEAAAALGVSQQAVSKRVARLESSVGAALLTRSRAGAKPTEDGAAFLPHARALLALADQAAAVLRARRRPLRVDVLARVAAPVDLLRSFYEGSGTEVDMVVSRGDSPREAALAGGSVDAAFGRVSGPLPRGFARVPAFLEPVPLLVGRRHRFARRKRVALAELAGVTAWMPGNAGDSEWAEYYRFLSAACGVRVDCSGPAFGGEHVVERIAASPDLATFGTTRQFPARPDVVQVAVVDPVPVYPWSLVWHEANRHPSLPPLVEHVAARFRPRDPGEVWMPDPDRALF